jgi:hypothetical protein
MGIDGGMMGATMLALATRPADFARLYPELAIMGIRIAPKAAVLATAEPTRLANIRQARIVT